MQSLQLPPQRPALIFSRTPGFSTPLTHSTPPQLCLLTLLSSATPASEPVLRRQGPALPRYDSLPLLLQLAGRQAPQPSVRFHCSAVLWLYPRSASRLAALATVGFFLTCMVFGPAGVSLEGMLCMVAASIDTLHVFPDCRRASHLLLFQLVQSCQCISHTSRIGTK